MTIKSTNEKKNEAIALHLGWHQCTKVEKRNKGKPRKDIKGNQG